MINTNTNTEIDSFKLRIPYNKVEIIDEKLEGTKITYVVETDEILKEFKDNALKFKENGISTRFAIEVMPTDNKGATKRYLTMLINAKLLKERYFEGITKDNIEVVYNELMQYNVARFSLQTFLEGFTTDTDFKTDVNCTLDEFEDMMQYFKFNARSSNQIGVGFQDFNKQTNKGIQFSNRETKQFKTNPFLKMYRKEIELKYKSKEFKDAYLKGQDIKGISRFEYTLKNNQHYKAVGIKSNTLSHLLGLSDSVKKSILKETINIHIDSSIKKMKVKEGMQPMEMLLHNLIVMQMKQGMSFDKITDFALSTFTDKVAKSRKKTQLNQIYNEYIKGTKRDVSTKNIDSIFSLIGVNNKVE